MMVCVCFRIFKDSKKNSGFACMFGHDLDKQLFFILEKQRNET